MLLQLPCILATAPKDLFNREKKLIACKPRLNNIRRAIRFTPARPFLCPRETIVSIPFLTSWLTSCSITYVVFKTLPNIVKVGTGTYLSRVSRTLGPYSSEDTCNLLRTPSPSIIIDNPSNFSWTVSFNKSIARPGWIYGLHLVFGSYIY